MKYYLNFRSLNNRGSALLVVTLITLMSLAVGITFMSRSSSFSMLSSLYSDSKSVNFLLESAHHKSLAKINRAINGALLNGKLRWVGGPTAETFNNISNTYANNALGFLKAIVTAQAYSGGGILNSSHEFSNFDLAFPSSWTDPDISDGEYYEVKYTFTPLDMVTQTNPQLIQFEYEYRIQIRAYGQKRFQSQSAEDTGVISATLSGAPFSQWAVFLNSMLNQSGQTLVFAGGNTSAQIREVYSGPVHVNQKPFFYGRPVFMDLFTSSIAETSWTNYSATNYSCCAVFNGGKQGSVPAISMPTQMFNMQRLAAGDPSNNAATNNSTVTNTELNTFLHTHATGSVTAGSSPPPDDIYIPVNNSSSLVPSGGIYIQGDAQIGLNVVQASSDFTTAQWDKIQPAHQGCKFQKISVTHMTSGVAPRDIYIGDDPCFATYVFNSSSPSSDPVILNGRINGNLHVNGKIDKLGGASRTRPAIAQDFSFTISALKDVRINNDLQYEDAKYYQLNADGSTGSNIVANPYGQVDSSGILPTADSLAPKVDSDSQTILGVVSMTRNIYIHIDAPANINLHAALYAGNSAAYNSSTGQGCGTSGANTQGCGFGYEGWNSKTGMGSIKFLGSLSEFKDQTTGAIATPPRGYASLYFYDSRLRQDITPPAFPISDSPQVSITVKPYKTWRMAQNSQ